MKKLLGGNPLTTLAGIGLAALYAIQEAQTNGITDWKQWLVPVAIVVLGRLAGDSNKTK